MSGTGTGGNGGAGVSGTGLSITNQGSITGGSGGAGGAGIAGSNLAIVNNGTIARGGPQANAITFTGGANTLTLAGQQGGSIIGNIGVTGSLDLHQDTNAVLTNVITGTGSVSKSGVGILELSGASTYTGGTTVNAGTLQLSGGSLASTGALTVNGGTFGLNGQTQTVGALSGTGGTIDLGAGTLTAGDSTTGAFAGTIIGSGGLIKQGNGTVILSGANTYTGDTVVNAGVLAVTGSLTGNTIVNAGGTLQGTGTVGATTVNSGGALGAGSSGTLTVGSLAQNAGSTFLAMPASLVSVTGTATLNGGTVSVLAGAWRLNTGYTILSATSRTGIFDGVTTSLPFLKPALAYNAGTVTLTVAPNFQAGAQTVNQSAIGWALTAAMLSTTSSDFENVVTTLANTNWVSTSAALEMLSAQPYANWLTSVSQSTQTFTASAQTLGGLGGGSTVSSGAGLPGSTYQALRIDGPDACGTACDIEPLWGAWGGGMGAFGTVSGDGNAHGLTYSLGGFIAGLDRRFAPDVRAGIATGFNAASLYTQGVPGYGTSNTLQFALYGEYAPGPLYLDALAGYGHSDNRMNRPIVIPGLPFRTAQGYTTANTFFGQLEAGYKIPVAPSFGGFVTPLARLQASTSTQNGFSETGADSLDLTVATQTTQSLRTVLGAQLGAAIDAPWREKLDVLFRLGWSHEYADLSRPVTAAFAGAPAISFTTFGAVAPRDGVVLGLGASTRIAERTSLYLRYDGDLAGANTNHVLNAGVRYVW
ncbi:MAG: autotransporter domain-containing protein [Reyranellales bacterium]